MNNVYVLACEVWGGSSYGTEIMEVFADEELAHKAVLVWQGNIPTCDTRYFVEVVEFNDLVP
jgi:hypothetical protein